MKKNAMLKIAAILLVAVLLTTCAISSTFAKYSTTGLELSETGTARAAKWGVGVNASFTGDEAIFDDTYGDGKKVAALSTTDLIVAPGTSNSIALSAALTGQPEVSGKVTVSVMVKVGSGWKGEDGTFYCPVTVNGEEIPSAAQGDEFVEVTTVEKEFDAKQDLSALAFDDTITWAWAFGEASVDDTEVGKLTNAPNATIQFKFVVDIEQTGPAVA